MERDTIEERPGFEMSYLSGRKLTSLGGALLLIAAAAAVRVAVLEEMIPPAVSARPVIGVPVPSVTEHAAAALAAEKDGNVGAALSYYRAAAALDPGCVDRLSPTFLGPVFEEKLKSWVAEMRSGRIAAGPSAMRDAAYLFRRMYGGCG
jgi:hypothetical protein